MGLDRIAPGAVGQLVRAVPGSFEAGLVEAVSAWCEAMRGDIGLDAALAQLAGALGAEAGLILRTRIGDGQQSRIALFDRKAAASAFPLRAAYADHVFGHYIERARTATVWTQSGCDPVDVELLADFQAARGLGEFCVLVLSGGPQWRDHMELHFPGRVGPEGFAILAAVVPMLVRNWASRQVGLASKSIQPGPMQDRAPAPRRAGLLDPTNPARLSRAEFRVCLLLARGLSVRGVCAELGLAEPTVRTHMRSIYAKTETASLAELVYLLMADRRRDPPGALLSA